VVVTHDDTVDRTTDGAGPVAGQSLETLRRLDAGRWFHARFAGERIPTLRDVLARYGARAHLHVEIKGRADGLTRRTVDAIRDGGMAARVTITRSSARGWRRSGSGRPSCPRVGSSPRRLRRSSRRRERWD
jgi:glycerophosphoryl diester phosphodiesterase